MYTKYRYTRCNVGHDTVLWRDSRPFHRCVDNTRHTAATLYQVHYEYSTLYLIIIVFECMLFVNLIRRCATVGGGYDDFFWVIQFNDDCVHYRLTRPQKYRSVVFYVKVPACIYLRGARIIHSSIAVFVLLSTF